MQVQDDFSVTYVRSESPQLFFLFVGVWNQLTIRTLDFVRATAIGDRNIAILKDPRPGHCYWRGVSDEYDSLDGIVRWQREQLAIRFAHVREVFCAGPSAGGGAAIYTALRLGARAAWSLGGRIARSEVVEERDRVAKELYERVLGRRHFGAISPDEHGRLVAALAEPVMRQRHWDLTGNPETVVDHDRVAILANLLRSETYSTDFHFYYATTNAIDRGFAHAFEGCPNVTLHPVTPPPKNWSEDVSFRDPDHGIVPMLHDMGQLRGLFSPYISAER